MSHVSLKNLTKSYDGKTNVLSGINLEINDGEFVVLVGPSGCGKSTLLRMVCGLEEITSGDLEIDHNRVNDLPPALRGIAMVFQSYALYPHMNVYKNMAFGLKVAGKTKDEADTRIRNAAKILKIDHLLERLPRELSGGQRQRVAIGRAIVREPKLFLFDEPLSNLDAALRVQTRLEIAKLHRELEATIVYVTHDQVEAMTLGDKIVVMHDGLIQQAGSPLELYQQPSNLFVATFIGSPKMNLLEGVVESAAANHLIVTLAGGQNVRAEVYGANATVGDRVTVGIRSEHLWEDSNGSERFSGTVDLVEHLGESNFLYLTLSTGQNLTVRGHGDREVKIGDAISISAPSAAFHVFDRDGKAFKRLKPGNMVAAKRVA
ncbi:sn-glycerol-3-phosphate ABC transporter ATP-binding protein UgpC [Silvimonas sp.]|uniref:ABC transporter ATP-binding protein n=1 Tax=Silvimonas sp. TaxID=2650811 RepID=UPI00284BDD19|nr:sn-glycerol-3-phosphate ABC transporter ATP-binding protein UgpC [Silvimonas sp.]MDR3428806.1 sn-glycerol-3-phosphate ABC transporter ATP-binding protein UgpC [Silvimonas sp.]